MFVIVKGVADPLVKGSIKVVVRVEQFGLHQRALGSLNSQDRRLGEDDGGFGDGLDWEESFTAVTEGSSGLKQHDSCEKKESLRLSTTALEKKPKKEK